MKKPDFKLIALGLGLSLGIGIEVNEIQVKKKRPRIKTSVIVATSYSKLSPKNKYSCIKVRYKENSHQIIDRRIEIQQA